MELGKLILAVAAGEGAAGDSSIVAVIVVSWVDSWWERIVQFVFGLCSSRLGTKKSSRNLWEGEKAGRKRCHQVGVNHAVVLGL